MARRRPAAVWQLRRATIVQVRFQGILNPLLYRTVDDLFFRSTVLYCTVLCSTTGPSSVPSVWGHATAYPRRSLPRVRRQRASSPQGRMSTGCCLLLRQRVTMDQLMCVSLFPHLLLVNRINVVGMCDNTFFFRISLHASSATADGLQP